MLKSTPRTENSNSCFSLVRTIETCFQWTAPSFFLEYMAVRLTAQQILKSWLLSMSEKCFSNWPSFLLSKNFWLHELPKFVLAHFFVTDVGWCISIVQLWYQRGAHAGSHIAIFHHCWGLKPALKSQLSTWVMINLIKSTNNMQHTWACINTRRVVCRLVVAGGGPCLVTVSWAVWSLWFGARVSTLFVYFHNWISLAPPASFTPSTFLFWQKNNLTL